MSENKRERVLVTGALGVIGSRILPMLARDFDVVPTDVGHSDLPGYVALDLMDFSQIYRLLEQVDSVVHLAVATGGGGRNISSRGSWIRWIKKCSRSTPSQCTISWRRPPDCA